MGMEISMEKLRRGPMGLPAREPVGALPHPLTKRRVVPPGVEEDVAQLKSHGAKGDGE